MSKPAPLYNRLALDRRWPNQLVDCARERVRKGAVGSKSSPPRAREATRRRVPNSALPIRWWRPTRPPSRRRSRDSCAFRSAPAAGSGENRAAHLAPGATVSDVGSVKGSVVRDTAPHLPNDVHFIPAHPVAGAEYSGPECRARPNCSSPLVHSHAAGRQDSAAVEKLAAFWRLIGANVEEHGARSSRPGARRHQPSAASDLLHHHRHCRRTGNRDAFRSAEVLRPAVSATSRTSPQSDPRRCGST